MTDLTSDNLETRLLEALPELRDRYEEEMRWWKEERPGKHVVINDVLLDPFLVSLLQSGGQEELVKRSFAFIEEMAHSPDQDVVNIVYVTVCERLALSHGLLMRAWRYMGERTRAISAEVEIWWGRGDNLPS